MSEWTVSMLKLEIKAIYRKEAGEGKMRYEIFKTFSLIERLCTYWMKMEGGKKALELFTMIDIGWEN